MSIDRTIWTTTATGIVAAGALIAASYAVPSEAAGTSAVPGVVRAADAEAVARCGGLRATIVGTGGEDRLVGTPRRDVIVGLGGDDRIEGRGGDDVVCGGAGADVISGGPGNDDLRGGTDRAAGDGLTRGDRLDGGAGSDRLAPGRDPRVRPDAYGPLGLERLDAITFRHATRGVRVDLGAGTARGQGSDRVVGSLMHVEGTRFDDDLRAGSTTASLIGGLGDDVLVGSDERDLLQGNVRRLGRPLPAGDDTIDGRDGRDELWFTGRAGGDVSGGQGTDLLYAEGGRGLRVDTGTGNDSVQLRLSSLTDVDVDLGPGAGDVLGLAIEQVERGETIEWALGSGAMTGPQGQATRFAGVTEVSIEPGPHDLRILGTPGRDDVATEGGFGDQLVEFRARAGADRFVGAQPRDLFDGGPGIDRLDNFSTDPRTRCISVERDPWDACV